MKIIMCNNEIMIMKIMIILIILVILLIMNNGVLVLLMK